MRCLFLLFPVVAACATAADSSSDISDATAFCSGYCKRIGGCDNTRDVQTCENTCKNQNAAVFPKLRSDVVSKISTCIDALDCKTVLGSDVVSSCSAEAVAQVAPSEVGKRFCDDLGATDTKCERSLDKAKCLDRAKLYNDKALGDADLCTKKACADVDACVDASLGAIATTSTSDSDAGTEAGAMCSAIGPGHTFDFQTTSCNDCNASSCCAPAQACASSPTCNALAQCLKACSNTNQACRNSCLSTFASGINALNAAAACFQSCASSCP